MPTKSPAQKRLMEAAAHTPGGFGGVSQAVGKEFVGKDFKVHSGVSIVAGDAEFNESDHPRAPDGKFGSGSGGGKAVKMSEAKKVGKQLGSNPGGVYEHNGQKLYIKSGQTKDHVRNELLAGDLYKLAGAPTLNYRPVEGGGHIATEWSALDKDNAHKFSPAEKKAAQADFAVHAWLANWDAVGTGGDNLGMKDGKPTALDLGGALEYRAQGSPKGGAFGNDVTEIKTMRDKSNRDAHAIFGDMSDADIKASVEKVSKISDDKIRSAVKASGGKPELADKLIARKNNMAKAVGLSAAKSDEPTPSAVKRSADGSWTDGEGEKRSAHETPDPKAGDKFAEAVKKEAAKTKEFDVKDTGWQKFKGGGGGKIRQVGVRTKAGGFAWGTIYQDKLGVTSFQQHDTSLEESERGKGLGGKMVGSLIAGFNAAGVSGIPIHSNSNPEFWAHINKKHGGKVYGNDEAIAKDASMIIMAFDRASMAGSPRHDVLAFDRSSATVRKVDKDGRLHVEITNISKATINPYRGEEIPGGDELGLDPAKIYYLLRDPEELKKAAATFNNIPLLDSHVVVSADDHRPERIVGSTGTDAVFEAPYLKNSLVIWSAKGIEAVESESKKELSSAYHYRADMTPGEYEGKKYDGVMRDIIGNHVALVEEGRAGSDVVVGDSAISIPNTNVEITMSKAKALSLKAHVAHGALLSYLAPKMAKDAKIDLGPLLNGITHKNFGARKAKLSKGITLAMDGKLAEDMSLAGLDDLLNMVEKTPVAGEDEATMEPKDGKNKEAMDADDDTDDEDSEGKAGMDADDDDEYMADDEDMTEEEKAAAMKAAKAKDKKAKDKAAKDKAAKDAEADKDDKEAAKDKKAMDQKIRLAADEAVKNERKNQQAIAEAREAVRPFVGAISPTMAFDSAGAVYRHALEALDIDVSKVTDDAALPVILGNLPKPGSQAEGNSNTTIAMDEAGSADFSKRFPGASRIGHA